MLHVVYAIALSESLIQFNDPTGVATLTKRLLEGLSFVGFGSRIPSQRSVHADSTSRITGGRIRI